MSFQRPWAYERGALWALDLDEAAPVSVTSQLAASFGEITTKDMAALVAAMGPADAGEVEQRFDAGSQCFAGWVDGKIAVYGWVSRGVERIGELERELRMRPDEAYIWDCATLPTYRRKGLYSALLGYMVRALGGQGVRRVWIGASLSNHPSNRVFAAVGFRPAVRLTYARALLARVVRVSDAPGAPPGLAADARRALVVSQKSAAPISTDTHAEEKRL
jgi:GNAT superfamily N-acetyltransferase